MFASSLSQGFPRESSKDHGPRSVKIRNKLRAGGVEQKVGTREAVRPEREASRGIRL